MGIGPKRRVKTAYAEFPAMTRRITMPNAFQFIDKVTGKAEKFSVIDDRLREMLGVQPDPKKYYRGWYDAFGLDAAIGKSFVEMREMYPKDDVEVQSMLAWLDERYTTNAWYEPK
jgi:hypothetical protein